MDVIVRDEEVAAYAGPAVVVAVPLGDAPLEGPAAAVDAALDGLIARLRQGCEFKGGLGDVSVLHTFGRLAAERVVVAGLGDPATLTVDGLRRAAAAAARAIRQAGLATFASTVYGLGRLAVADATQAIVEGTVLGLYRFDAYRTSGAVAVQELAVLRGALARDAVDEGMLRGREVAAGVTLARDLINEPPNVLTPSEVPRRAQELAAGNRLECTV